MTPEQEMLRQTLAPIRLPGDFANFGLGDFISFCALGILIGMLLATIIKPFFREKLSRSDELKSRIEALRIQEDEPRWLGLCQLALEQKLTLTMEERNALFDPDVSPDFSAMEGRLMCTVHKVQRAKKLEKART